MLFRSGHSVLEVLRSFEAACGHAIPHQIVAKRPGDTAITVADPSRAQQVLGWRTQRSLRQICEDGWTWQRANPQGYRP